MPLVSCHLPTTHTRRQYLPTAIRCFLDQTYADRELVILDDGDVPVLDLVPSDPRIRYFYEPPRQFLGVKRERLAHLSHGEIFAQWDDDDWSHPERLERQVAALNADPSKECCLLYPYVLYSSVEHRACLWNFPGTLTDGPGMYRRRYWERGGFPPMKIGAAITFIMAKPRDLIVTIDGRELFCALRHGDNTASIGMRGDKRWEVLDPEPYARLFLDSTRVCSDLL